MFKKINSPFLLLSIGILYASGCRVSVPLIPAIGVSLGGLSIFILIQIIKHPPFNKPFFLILILGVTIGITRTEAAIHYIQTTAAWTQSGFKGILTDIRSTPTQTKYKITTLRGTFSFKEKDITSSHQLFTLGDILFLSAQHTPYPLPTNPGQPNLRKNGLSANLMGQLTHIKIYDKKSGWAHFFITSLHELQLKIIAIHQTLLPLTYANLLISFIFGDENITLDETWKESFMKTGLTHLLVVSGAQIALLNMGFITLFQTLSLKKKTQFLLLSLINTLFYFLCSGGISILRAILMSQFALGSKILGRKTPAIHHLTVIAALFVLIHPYSILNIGFQLSFFATAALIWLAPHLDSLFPKKLPQWLKTTLCTSLATFILTTPLLWWHFQSISIVSILANIIITPWTELIVICGFISTCLGLIHTSLAAPLDIACATLLALIDMLTSQIKNLPLAYMFLPKPSFVTISLYYLCLLLISEGSLILLAPPPLLLIMALITHLLPTPFNEITLLDVGQGDSCAIITRSKKTFIIDTGDHIPHGFDAGKEIITPFLKSKGISQIDGIILTHADKDHVGGCTELIKTFPVKALYHNGFLPQQLPQLYQLAKKKRIQLIKLKASDSLALAPRLDLFVLYPDPSCKSTDKTNNQSIALKIITPHLSLLMTGDLESEKELHLAKTASLASTILKLGHHGSKTSSTETFIRKTHPKLAVISVGRYNKFHHPADTVLARINYHHIPILRTDQNGAITIKISKKTYRIIPFLKPPN